MGMFDDLRTEFPLPRWKRQFQRVKFQTKDTPAQFLDEYVIRKDGTLWHQEYDTEDHSEAGLWKKAHPGKRLPKRLRTGLAGLCGCMTRVNRRWRKVKFDGEIQFYRSVIEHGQAGQSKVLDHGWVCFSAYFVAGKLALPIRCIEFRPGKLAT